MKKITLLLAMVGLFVVSVMPAQAQKKYGLTEAAGKANYSVSESSNVYEMSSVVINGILALIGFVFFGYFLYAGLRWLTAQGKKEAIEKAKATMISSVIGLVVIAGAYALTNFVLNALSK